MRGNPMLGGQQEAARQHEREFDGEYLDSAAPAAAGKDDLGQDSVDNPLAWEEPIDEEDSEEEEVESLRPVVLVPREWAAPAAPADEWATVLAPGAQLPATGSEGGGVCFVGSQKYEWETYGWVLVADADVRLEVWERGFSAETRNLVAFEVLMQSMRAGEGEGYDDHEDHLIDMVRVQLNIRCVPPPRLPAWLCPPPPHKLLLVV